MAKKRTSHGDKRAPASIERRAALKQIGAIALYGPALASIACGADESGKDMSGNPATGGATPGGGASPGGPGGGSGADAGAPPGNGGTGGNNPSGGGGNDAGGPHDAGMQAQPDGSHVPVSDAGADAGVMAVGDAGAGSGGFFPPMFMDAPACTLTPIDPAREGPFFVHEDEVMTDPTLKRVDIRDGKPGVELQLNLRMLDLESANTCMKPISDVEVYVWHTDALGLYSGFNGQDPNRSYMPPADLPPGAERGVENGDRFCRGMQVTNADGVVSFRSIYPGWYFGRPIHIHFLALRKGSGPATTSYRSAQYHVFTTQMYFEGAFSKMIHENNAPYTMRTNVNGYTTYVQPGSSTVRPTARMEGNIVVASLNIITNSKQSRGAT